MRIRRGLVEEYQVEVGTKTEFLAAEAAVTEYGEARTRDGSVRAFDLALREREHHDDHAIGEPGELPCAVLRRLARIQGRQRDAETQSLAHFVERHQDGFRV